MTKSEWSVLYRTQRLARPKYALTQGTVMSALKELYDYIYTDEQEAVYRLRRRYHITLSKAQSEQIAKEKIEAKTRATVLISSLVYTRNPFLALLSKSDMGGAYVPVPLEYK